MDQEQSPDEIARRLTFGGIPDTEAVALKETVEKSTRATARAEAAISDLQQQLLAQQGAMAQQSTMMSLLVDTVNRMAGTTPASTNKTKTERTEPRERASKETAADPSEGLHPTSEPPNEEAEDTDLSAGQYCSPSRTILGLYRLSELDPDLHSTTKVRATTTAVSLTAWYSRLRPSDVQKLQLGVQKKGPTAAATIATYKQEVESTLACELSTRGAMVIDALSNDQEHQRSTHVDALTSPRRHRM